MSECFSFPCHRTSIIIDTTVAFETWQPLTMGISVPYVAKLESVEFNCVGKRALEGFWAEEQCAGPARKLIGQRYVEGIGAGKGTVGWNMMSQSQRLGNVSTEHVDSSALTVLGNETVVKRHGWQMMHLY